MAKPAPLLALALLASSVSCGDDGSDGESPGGPTGTGGGPGREICAAHEVELAPGECGFVAGVPPEQCGAGFAATGDGSCAPVLPSAPCPSGQMAVPGDATCRPVAGCGDSAFAGIPTDATTEHVDASFTGTSDGSEAAPWKTIQAAVDAAAPSSIVAVAGGTYVEEVFLQGKAVRLWGRCPELVEIVGSVPQQGAVQVYPGVTGAEVRSLAIRGGGLGVAYSGVSGLLLDRLWIHDTQSRGIGAVPNPSAPSTVMVTGSLIEAATECGIFFTESVAVESTVIRGTRPDPTYAGGQGIMVQGQGSLSLTGSVIDANLEFGVYLLGSSGTIASSVITGTTPQPTSGQYGIGVIAANAGPVRSTLQIASSFVAGNTALGVGVVESDVELTATVVRTTQQSSGVEARGSTLIISSSIFEDNRVAGLRLIESEADVDGLLVRRSLGYGVLAQNATFGLRSSRIEDNRVAGVFLLESQSQLDRVSLARTVSDPAFNGGGDGLAVQSNAGAPASATLTRSRVTGNERAGVSSFGAIIGVSDVAVQCNAIDFNGEATYASVGEMAFSFDQTGEVECGCDEAASCLVQSANLAPPTID